MLSVPLAAFAVAAFKDPDKFNKQSISLAAESLTMKELGAIIEEVTGEKISVESLSYEEAENQGIAHAMVVGHQWFNEVGYKVDIDALKKYNIKLTSFREWVELNKNQLFNY